MTNSQIIDHIQEYIKKGTIIAPFLFFGQNSELLEQQIIDISHELLANNNAPKTAFFHFSIPDKNIKIKDIKAFIEPSFSRANYGIQIFYIPDVSRLTVSSSNSLLKFLEEPAPGNIILLSSQSESGILDTILSRTHTIPLWWKQKSKEDPFYQDLINSHIQKKNQELVSYFFRNKLEKQDYVSFLENLIIYSKKHLCFIPMLQEIEEDINAIIQNNALPRNIVDKWILQL